MSKVVDFKQFEGGFALKVDTDQSETVYSVVLVFPNNTQATIRGDEEVVKQIVDRLDGLIIKYKTKL